MIRITTKQGETFKIHETVSRSAADWIKLVEGNVWVLTDKLNTAIKIDDISTVMYIDNPLENQ